MRPHTFHTQQKKGRKPYLVCQTSLRAKRFSRGTFRSFWSQNRRYGFSVCHLAGLGRASSSIPAFCSSAVQTVNLKDATSLQRATSRLKFWHRHSIQTGGKRAQRCWMSSETNGRWDRQSQGTGQPDLQRAVTMRAKSPRASE